MPKDRSSGPRRSVRPTSIGISQANDDDEDRADDARSHAASAIHKRSRGLVPLRNAAKSPFAPAKLSDGLAEIIGTKIWPQRRREEELRIGGLPKEKIADAMFARKSG